MVRLQVDNIDLNRDNGSGNYLEGGNQKDMIGNKLVFLYCWPDGRNCPAKDLKWAMLQGQSL